MKLFNWFRNSEPSASSAADTAKLESIFDELTKLGFMKYVRDEDFSAVRQQVIHYLKFGAIESDWDDHCNSNDRRGYIADNEDLAEGCIPDCILSMKDVLEREGVRITSVESGNREGCYDVIINGECFPISDRSTPMSQDWALATKRLLEIVNELLTRVGSRERLYGLSGGHDGRVILLTSELRTYIAGLAIAKDSMPYGPDEIDINL
jgi:hypothetical protein